jgi:hypothetical protein
MLLALLAAFSACRMSPEAAREELARRNTPFSEEEFLKRVEEGDAEVVNLFLIAGANANAKIEAVFRITEQSLGSKPK